MGDLERALRDNDRAIELNLELALLYINRGTTYRKLGELGKATADYKKVIALDQKTGARAYLCLGFIHHDRLDHQQTLECFDSAVRLSSGFEDDFIQSKSKDLFADAASGLEAPWVEIVRETLEAEIEDPDAPVSPSDYYYCGVRALYWNDKAGAFFYFKRAQELGFEDVEKVNRHLNNLETRLYGRRRKRTGS